MKHLVEWVQQVLAPKKSARISFNDMFATFKEILALNNQTLDLIANANDMLSGDYIFDRHFIDTFCQEVAEMVHELIYKLQTMVPHKYEELTESFQRIESEINRVLTGRLVSPVEDYILPYEQITRALIEAVGEKNAHLAEIKSVLGLKTPAGFAITTTAYFAFLEENGLSAAINETVQSWQEEEIDLEQASGKIRELILAGRVPKQLKKEIEAAIEQISPPTPDDPDKIQLFAVRSSAVGEDGEHSFAGQYQSEMNLPREKIIDAYKEVLASAYGERAMEYRRHMGIGENEIAMAVACQPVIDAKASGVLYTYDPVKPEDETMLISSSWGLGERDVSSAAIADHFTIERRPPHNIQRIKIVRKATALEPIDGGGTRAVEVTEDRQTAPALSNEQLQGLAELGLKIEKFYKKPQDIEFAIDRNGDIIVLQSRQLSMQHQALPRASELAEILENYPVIIQGKGTIAQEGIAAGQVWKVRNNDDLNKIPIGSILVARYASPNLTRAMKRISGIMTDIGSATGHLATIAREFRIPTIMNMETATDIFQTGQEITMDAQENVIYQGLVKELHYYSLAEEEIEETFEYRLLRRVLRKIEPLNLIDPADSDFSPESCRTFHDITRFVHEKAVQELIDFNYYHPHSSDAVAGRLQWSFPLDMVVIDIGGGLAPGTGGTIVPSQVTSPPMTAVLKGMSHPGAWDTEPVSVDFGSFMSSLTRTMSSEATEPQQVGQNLAVISSDYVNISLRLGYHFTVIDAYAVDDIKDNYAYFRFSGGVTEQDRRNRRARFVAEVLKRNDFHTEVHDDLIVGSIKKIDQQGILKRLYLFGILIGFTRQLDVKMVSEEHINLFADKIDQLMEDYHGL
ncbi:MAG: hypothetical protein GWP11_00070 [Proteobacteria bacterium]|nr:hypothetical protein [Pseudomonadota bacterium]